MTNRPKDTREQRSDDAISNLELSLMNSRVREWLLRYWDFPLFASTMQRHNIQLGDATVLEAGCGSGYSTMLIFEYFQPKALDAFDLVPGQVERARARQMPARFFVGDIADTRLSSHLYEAVFVCGVLHHCALWHTALAEMSRLLKDGGILLMEEPTKPFVTFERHLVGSSAANNAWRGFREVRAELAKVGLGIMEDRPLYSGLFRSLMCVKMTGQREFRPRSSLIRHEARELAQRQGVPA